ncbi:transcriptional regulator [Candidatus Bathyarchaeota archaeon]|nr:transcriptional regulator [Candidatus Bathyarchaeota archaeon]MBS7613243.1 transcriptional regulator [Candidatus Bathyarchaeota archaeon]MBS7618027.1 transcriptional regulator [Candidatus Bathyarchaeota archaeon]
MSKDQVIGALLLAAGVLGILVYAYLVFLTDYALLVLKLTGFVAVGGVLAILAWIGYTLATTPPPKPIEDIEREIEQELKKEEKSETSTSQ